MEGAIGTNLNATEAADAPVIIERELLFTQRNCPCRTNFPALAAHLAG